MIIDGERRHLIQFGTVMTDEPYRNRGPIRRLMTEIETDFHNFEGIYLFANDSAFDFYPKFGFRKAKECMYRKKVACSTF